MGMPAKIGGIKLVFKFPSTYGRANSLDCCRSFHQLHPRSATPLSIGVVGPPPSPPSPPLPAASQYGGRIERRRKQAEMLQKGKELRASQSQQGRQSPLKKRFWQDVDVRETPGGYQIFLDSRPVRTPHKTILTIPLSKPHLAHAIALEWDLLTSAQQALKNHHTPLTSLSSRADSIKQQESPEGGGSTHTRTSILQTVMRFLDTDTLLCWAPEESVHDAHQQGEMHEARTGPRSLREIQRRTAQPILAYLTSRVWPGARLHPVLDTASILPTKQPETTKSIIRGWITGLPAYELAALERGALATKSLLVATRLLVEWSEEFRRLQNIPGGGDGDGVADEDLPGGGQRKKTRFGVDEAARACSTEVTWQTDLWGEVEDTHDVDREDLRRQLGSVVLLVSGNRWTE